MYVIQDVEDIADMTEEGGDVLLYIMRLEKLKVYMFIRKKMSLKRVN